jgi:hypothetical protein
MALNPYFIQGNSSEQRLIQDLINEQLKMYGVNIGYMPRGYALEDGVLRENILGRFNDNYYMEAYVASYGGFGGGGDILSKFGVKANDDLSLIVSREKFEDFITPFIEAELQEENLKISNRPKEGDLIYFPLTDTLYEVKFVEHEVEFYQLNKLYVYELKCEPFMFEDELIDTGVHEIDHNMVERGIDAILTLTGIANTAGAGTTVAPTGGVNRVHLVNDGWGYTSTPIVTFSAPPAGGKRATAVAITTQRPAAGYTTAYSIDRILITDPGGGYVTPPTITISGGGGSGGIATAGISTNGTISRIVINNAGSNYAKPPIVTISAPGAGTTATAEAFINSQGVVSRVYITNAGSGYTTIPSITFTSPGISTGNYLLNELITGATSGTKAVVKDWDAVNKKLRVYRRTGRFTIGEVIVGSAKTSNHIGIGSTGRYILKSVDYFNDQDLYAENDEIESEADTFLDFTENNPFGEY